MKIAIDLIKPSPNPVRTSWDEDKMNELAQSIKEQGLIVPIKVRPLSNHPALGSPPGGYEIVYGHRRVEACKRAGLGEVEAIVEGVDDTNILIQAGLENIQNEDMSILDKARWVRRVKNITGWGLREIDRKTGLQHGTLSGWLSFLDEHEQGIVPSGFAEPGGTDSGFMRTMEVKRAFKKANIDDNELKKEVLAKTANLTYKQTRKMADAVASARDDAEREAILQTEYEHVVTSPAFIRGKAEAKRKAEKKETKKRQEEPREVAKYFDALRVFKNEVTEAVAVAKFGKFSPEAARFTKQKHDQLRELLIELEKTLEV